MEVFLAGTPLGITLLKILAEVVYAGAPPGILLLESWWKKIWSEFHQESFSLNHSGGGLAEDPPGSDRRLSLVEL